MDSRLPAAVSIRFAVAVAAALAGTAAAAQSLPAALDRLTREGRVSGAIVVRGPEGVRFARGYGMADPLAARAFTPDTPVDSASLAKPVTAAAVLALARDGTIDLDAPVRKYLPAFPYADVTVRHLLAHSPGLPVEQMLEPITGKTNAMFVVEMAERKLPLLFPPGSSFVSCNLCYTSLAAVIEAAGGKPYLRAVRERAALPPGITIRPARLADWTGRGIGYRRGPGGEIERADSADNELFSGAANFSISAAQLARWGTEWWKPALRPLRAVATTPAAIAGKTSGLTWGQLVLRAGRPALPLSRPPRGLPPPALLEREAQALRRDGHQQLA